MSIPMSSDIRYVLSYLPLGYFIFSDCGNIVGIKKIKKQMFISRERKREV